MKIVKAAVLFLLLTLILSGCSSLELSQREIIDAVAIDYDAEGYTVTIAAFAISKNKNGYKVYSETGKSLQYAFGALSQITTRSLMYENNSLILLGADAYRYKYESIMGYLLSSYEGDMNTQVVGVRTKAGETIKAISSQGGSFAALVVNLTDDRLQRRSYPNPLYKCAPNQRGNYDGQLLPILELNSYQQNGDRQNQTEMALAALGLITKNGWATDISGEDLNAVMLLQNKIKKIPIQVLSGENTLNAHLQDPRIRISRNMKHKNSLTVSCTAELVVPNTVSVLSEQDKSAMRQQAKDYLNSMMQQCVLRYETDFDFDVIGSKAYVYLISEKTNFQDPHLEFHVEIK